MTANTISCCFRRMARVLAFRACAIRSSLGSTDQLFQKRFCGPDHRQTITIECNWFWKYVSGCTPTSRSTSFVISTAHDIDCRDKGTNINRCAVSPDTWQLRGKGIRQAMRRHRRAQKRVCINFVCWHHKKNIVFIQINMRPTCRSHKRQLSEIVDNKRLFEIKHSQFERTFETLGHHEMPHSHFSPFENVKSISSMHQQNGDQRNFKYKRSHGVVLAPCMAGQPL